MRTLGRPDLVVWTDGDLTHLVDLDEVEVPTVCLMYDPHLLKAWAAPYAEVFDHVVSTQKGFVSQVHGAIRGSANWFPYWADLNGRAGIRPKPFKSREIDVAFVGNAGKPSQSKRDEFLRKVFERLAPGVRVHVGPGDWQDVYSRSKIVLNVPVDGDLNMRVFEGMACGALVFSPRSILGTSDLFEFGSDLKDYDSKDVEQTVAEIERALRNGTRSQEIAHNGYLKVSGNHLLAHRARQMKLLLAQIGRERRPSAPAPNRSLAMSRALLSLALDPPVVQSEGWRWWFDDRLALAEGRLKRAGSENATEAMFLRGLLSFLKKDLAGAVQSMLAAGRDAELEPVARYGASRGWRLLGESVKANAIYPIGLRAGALARRPRRYWDLLIEVLNFKTKDFVAAGSSGAGSRVVRSRVREGGNVIDTSRAERLLQLSN